MEAESGKGKGRAVTMTSAEQKARLAKLQVDLEAVQEDLRVTRKSAALMPPAGDSTLGHIDPYTPRIRHDECRLTEIQKEIADVASVRVEIKKDITDVRVGPWLLDRERRARQRIVVAAVSGPLVVLVLVLLWLLLR